MLVSFNDDSGTHDGAKVVLLCGFLADGDDWLKIDAPWNAVLSKQEWPSVIKAFHTFDCVDGVKEFLGWSYAQRLAMLGDLVNVIVSLPIMAIGAAVIVRDFNALSLEDRELFKKDKKATPLEFIFHLQMQQIIHKGVELKHADQIGVVFETSKPATEDRFRDMYIDYRDGFHLGDRLLGRPLFLDKKQPALQAADILAYCTYQLVMQNYFPSDAAPTFVMAPFMRMLDGIVHDGGIYDATALESLLRRARANDPSLIGNRKKRQQRENER